MRGKPNDKMTEEQKQALMAYWETVRRLPLQQPPVEIPLPPEKLLSLSRLTTEEKQRTLADLKGISTDERGEIIVLRNAVRRLVEKPYGWWMLVGAPGNAKSMVLSIIVAEACRRGFSAKYYLASEIDRATKPPLEYEDGREYEGNPDAFKSMAKRLKVLAIDECDKLAWTPWQIQHIGEILEHRYREANNRLTVFAANLPPEMWNNADKIKHRLRKRSNSEDTERQNKLRLQGQIGKSEETIQQRGY